MILRLMSLLAALAFTRGGIASAAEPLSYDDPGMHFQAPDGWTRIELRKPEGADQGSDDGAPAAVFGWHAGQTDQRTIVITIKPFSGTLAGFESQHESDLRGGSGGTFVDKRTQTTLPNGMPMYVVRVSQGNEIGRFIRRYDYLIFDGERGIDVAFIGRQNDFDEKDVQAALSSLYVVTYPRRRS
ncbi:MAG: hypothetical protein M3R53_09290 [Candidatus Eremiobacteraeota bacterium]|nr:hypothetical protein [Candidatus Eremiobacteraeota bacterium]